MIGWQCRSKLLIIELAPIYIPDICLFLSGWVNILCYSIPPQPLSSPLISFSAPSLLPSSPFSQPTLPPQSLSFPHNFPYLRSSPSLFPPPLLFSPPPSFSLPSSPPSDPPLLPSSPPYHLLIPSTLHTLLFSSLPIPT